MSNPLMNAQIDGAIDKRFGDQYNYLIEMLSQKINSIESSIVALNQTLSAAEVDTGMKWIDGRHIFRKFYAVSLAVAGTTYTTSLGISADLAWIDHSYTFIQYATNSTVLSFYYVDATDNSICYINASSQLIVKYTSTGTLYAAVNYIKTA